MSILNIKERFSQRILQSEDLKNKNDANTVKTKLPLVSPRSLLEADVGITEYVSDLPGFHAIIKQRYSDFNVHEIDSDGNMVVLNNLELPDESLGAEALETKLLSTNVLEQLECLFANKNPEESVVIDVTENSKEDRRNIHQFLKAKYGDTIISNTSDENEKKLITVKYRNGGNVKDFRRAGHLPKYLHFVLSKANMDTTQALSVIGSKLRLKVSNFHIAGTKDKRANTSQGVSVKNVYASQLREIKNLRNIWLGNFVYKKYPLSLGSLVGNNFQIALRDVVASSEEIDSALAKLREHGFINYFGLQRFGNNADSPTHEVGRMLIKESFGQAVELILKPRPGREPFDIRSAREIYARTRDASKALSALRNIHSIEAKLLQGLKKHGPHAFVNALDNVPRNVRLLYLHAYQSYIWNKIVSRRLATLGMKLLEGDLVLIDEGVDCDVIDDILSSDAEGTEATESNLAKHSPVKHLFAEDLDKYTIYDVVLPLPGCATIYPKNEIHAWYRELLGEDDLTTESLDSRVRLYALQGSYRKILKKPKNCTWRLVTYSKPEDDLILGDFDLLEGKKLPDIEGALRAVIVSLDLDPSTYATMALREILREDTSAGQQKLLNDYSNKRQSEDQQSLDAGEIKKLKVEPNHLEAN